MSSYTVKEYTRRVIKYPKSINREKHASDGCENGENVGRLFLCGNSIQLYLTEENRLSRSCLLRQITAKSFQHIQWNVP